MRTLRKQRAVVAIRVPRKLTRIRHQPVLLPEFATLKQQIHPHHRHAPLHQRLHILVRETSFPRVIQPDHHPPIPLLRVQPGHTQLLVIRLVRQRARHFQMVPTVLLVLQLPFHLTRLLIRAANDHFHRIAENL